MINNLYDQNFVNISEAKELEKIKKYVENCHHYGYQKYISPKYYKNKSIKNAMLNTNYLEFMDKQSSPYNLSNIYQMNTNFRTYKNISKNESADAIVDTEDYQDRVKDLNYLAETKFVEQMMKLNEINKSNTELINEYHKGDDLVNGRNDIAVDEKLIYSHLKNYLTSIQEKKDYKQSLGMSKFDKPQRQINDNPEMSLEDAQQGDQTNNTANQARGYEKTESKNEYINSATNILDGIQTVYPFLDQTGNDDLNEVMDSTSYLPNSKILY